MCGGVHIFLVAVRLSWGLRSIQREGRGPSRRGRTCRNQRRLLRLLYLLSIKRLRLQHLQSLRWLRRPLRLERQVTGQLGLHLIQQTIFFLIFPKLYAHDSRRFNRVFFIAFVVLLVH